MAEEKRPKTEKKRTVDKWKKKIWYSIIAPKEFDEKVIGETPATKPEHVLNRIVKISVRELTKDAKKQHITAHFKIIDVKGTKAHTAFVGHVIADAYLKRIIRRRNSKIELVKDINTSDGKTLRIKIVTVTNKKAHRSQETTIRKIMSEQLEKLCAGKTATLILIEIIFGTIINKIFNAVKKIHTIKRVEIIKSQILNK